MKKLILFTFLISTMAFCLAEDFDKSGQLQKDKNNQVPIPEGFEETYKNFVTKITRKDEDSNKDPFKKPIPEMSFELEYAGLTIFPVILSNDTYSSTESLVDRYNTYKSNHGKTVAANDKLYEDRFYQQQEEIQKLYDDLNKRNTSREYLFLAGVLSTDNGEQIIRDKYIILLNPKYSDREWIQWKIDQHMQKRVALTLTAVDGNAMNFLSSDRNLTSLSVNYDDPIISFILSPLYTNGTDKSLQFFSKTN